MKFVDLFCGAGGLSLGFIEAGGEALLCVDNWDDAIRTHESNLEKEKLSQLGHHEMARRCGPCLNVDLFKAGAVQEIESALNGERPDWIIGGPPCKGFSTVGQRNRNDPRNSLVMRFADVVEKIRPQGFLIENVLGLRDMDFIPEVVKHFSDLGYSVSPAVLVSANYGVPQLRRRVVFVGTFGGRYFLKPTPTRTPDTYVSVEDAIGDLPKLSAGETATEYSAPPFSDYQRAIRKGSSRLQGHVASKHPQYIIEAISYIPDGGNRTHIPPHLQPTSGFHNSYSRLHSKSPAVAITQNMGKPSGTRCVHPNQNRGLTAREGARLQGFPDWFEFYGGIVSQREQIANAVPPILAKEIACALCNEESWTSSVIKAVNHNGLDLAGNLVAVGNGHPQLSLDV